MAMAAAILSFSLSFLLLCFHASLAQLGAGQQRSPWQSQRRFGDCRIERLDALEPNRRIESEAGLMEFWEQDNDQFRCAGVTARRTTIQSRGLLLPMFSNAPRLVYIQQGTGIIGMVIPGCPEAYHSFRQTEEQSQRSGDQHQKVHRFRQGDIIALPAGVVQWCYNEGDTPVVAITLVDTSNNANQLDSRHRQFLLAGSQQGRQQPYEYEQQQQREGRQQPYEYEQQQREVARQEGFGDNVFNGFDLDTLSEVLGVSRDTARRLQGQNDTRGNIVRVKNDLRVLRPFQIQEQQQQQQEEEEEEQGRTEEREREGWRFDNGIEETFCSMKIRENIDDPSRADVFSHRGGRLTSLNSQKLPILRYLQLSAERGVLYRYANHAPHWNINAHSIMYVTGGRGRVQIVGNRGQTAFDGELRRGQLVVVPQNFMVVKQARSEGFQWVSFKTNDNAMTSSIVGKTSILRGMPEEVLMNSYRISREEARSLKHNRGEEMTICSPSLRTRKLA